MNNWLSNDCLPKIIPNFSYFFYTQQLFSPIKALQHSMSLTPINYSSDDSLNSLIIFPSFKDYGNNINTKLMALKFFKQTGLCLFFFFYMKSQWIYCNCALWMACGQVERFVYIIQSQLLLEPVFWQLFKNPNSIHFKLYTVSFFVFR